MIGIFYLVGLIVVALLVTNALGRFSTKARFQRTRLALAKP
jgi:hypothetical protein